jgi:hypothetical protein
MLCFSSCSLAGENEGAINSVELNQDWKKKIGVKVWMEIFPILMYELYS